MPLRAPIQLHFADRTRILARVHAFSIGAMALLGLMGPAAVARAEQQAAASPPAAAPSGEMGSIRGVVIDSIREGFLDSAVVELLPVHRIAITDVSGHYHFDGVPAGTDYKLHIEHALLDTVGIDLTTTTFAVLAGRETVQDVHTPTPGRIVGQICSKSDNFQRGPALLTGFIRDPNTNKPLDSATVTFAYVADHPGSLGIMKDTALRRWSRDSLTATGRYRFCGLPTTDSGTIQVTRKGLATSEFIVKMHDELLALRSIGLEAAPKVVTLAPTDSGAKPTQVLVGLARLRGRVQSKSGVPIAGAHVSIAGTASAALTRADGTFLLDSLPSGTMMVEVVKLGFNPFEGPVDLKIRETGQTTITMPDYVPVLPAVVSTSDYQKGLDRVGFSERKQKNIGGYFLSGDQITHGIYFSDAVRRIPGFKVIRNPGNSDSEKNVIIYRLGGNAVGSDGCINYWLDGHYFNALDQSEIDDEIDPKSIQAIEAYSPNQVPPQFDRLGQSNCATLVIWTTQSIHGAVRNGG